MQQINFYRAKVDSSSMELRSVDITPARTFWFFCNRQKQEDIKNFKMVIYCGERACTGIQDVCRKSFMSAIVHVEVRAGFKQAYIFFKKIRVYCPKSPTFVSCKHPLMV
ncbi:hypothetical protein ABZP36_000214 [Zizania latifolia]